MGIDSTTLPVRDIAFEETVTAADRFDQMLGASLGVLGFLLVQGLSGSDTWLGGALISFPMLASVPGALRALAILMSGRTLGMRRYCLRPETSDGGPAPRARVLLRDGPGVVLAILVPLAAVPALIGDSAQDDIVSLALMAASFAATGAVVRQVRGRDTNRDGTWRDEFSGTRLVADTD